MRKHFRMLRTLLHWLVREGKWTAPSPVTCDDEPKVPEKVFLPLADGELRVYGGGSFEDRRRDTAIIRVMNSGTRVEALREMLIKRARCGSGHSRIPPCRR